MESLDTRLQKRMHVSLYALLFLTCLLGLSVLLEGCTDRCESEITYTYFEPVYTSFEDIQANTRIMDARPIDAVGKIYIKDQFLFINEPGEGIHIFNNSNPSQPDPVSFLSIPGNYDLAVKGNTLYADSYVDLVAFDISNIFNVREVSRQKGVFDYFRYDIGFVVDSQLGVITSWRERTDKEVKKGSCTDVHAPVQMYCGDGGVFAENRSLFSASLAIAPGTGSGPGVGGSMARFTINQDFLYALVSGYIQPFDLTNETQPVASERSYVAGDVETIFPYGKRLFIGASSGMHIFQLSNPAMPEKISTYQHIRSCDPVVVQGDLAYVTLRSGNECAGFTNQLDVINIEDATNPKVLKIYPMTNPHGLGVDSDLLFVCDGSAGLKIYKADDVMQIDKNLIMHYANIRAVDVIPFNNVLIMIGQDGIFQYDYSDPGDIKLLSHIGIQ